MASFPTKPSNSSRSTPIYTWKPTETFAPGRWAFHKYPVPQLPTSPTHPWSINLFMKPDVVPARTAIIGGFGDTEDVKGTQRYIIIYQGSAGFWGSNADCLPRELILVNEWQMVSVTYDGTSTTVYHNAHSVMSSTVELNKAEPVVNLATEGPWPQVDLYRGKISNFSIWRDCLQPLEIEELYNLSDVSKY